MSEKVPEVSLEKEPKEEVLAEEESTKEESAEEVPTEEDKQLRDYELVLVISPEVAEEEFEATIDNISRLITGGGGIISDIEKWGKRKLAYPIRYFVEGSYVLAKFKMKPAFDKEMEANLRLSEEVIRHLLIRTGS